MMPGQPGMMPGQPGMMQGQPGMMQGQPGMMQGQPGMMPGQPGMMPGINIYMNDQPIKKDRNKWKPTHSGFVDTILEHIGKRIGGDRFSFLRPFGIVFDSEKNEYVEKKTTESVNMKIPVCKMDDKTEDIELRLKHVEHLFKNRLEIDPLLSEIKWKLNNEIYTEKRSYEEIKDKLKIFNKYKDDTGTFTPTTSRYFSEVIQKIGIVKNCPDLDELSVRVEVYMNEFGKTVQKQLITLLNKEKKFFDLVKKILCSIFYLDREKQFRIHWEISYNELFKIVQNYREELVKYYEYGENVDKALTISYLQEMKRQRVDEK